MLICLILAGLAIGAAQDTPSRAKETYARAIELDAKGNHSAALALLWEAAGLSPRDPEIQNTLGEALDRIGALDAAIAAYRVAVHENPQFRKASNNLILALVKAGKGEEAVQRARDLAAQAPSDPDRYFTLGLAQSEQNIDDAMKSFRRALEIDPRHALARYNLALALNRTDRTTEAIEEMKKTLAIDPRAESRYMLGVMYSHQGEFDAAIRELKAAIANNETENIEEEIGDLLFVVTNLARKLDIEPETALKRCNRKFRKRFRFIENELRSSGKKLDESGLDEMDALWNAAKLELN